MYAVENVKKFVKDNPDMIKNQEGIKIIERAEELSEEGVISGSSLVQIMGCRLLAEAFHIMVVGSPEHLKIAQKAISSL
ncbi:hypothetical protein C0584_01675 [Candidatus Parcubacteria bacterium]|nr:MAG: hypothetical protein C0584_01675 [Candidatus Parcubacteria bacterium]